MKPLPPWALDLLRLLAALNFPEGCPTRIELEKKGKLP